jgi:hypothetical protein
MNVREALAAISTTGKGRCWYCDLRLPKEDEAYEKGWDVQRVHDHAVPSIILVCPSCLRLKADLGEEALVQTIARRATTLAC